MDLYATSTEETFCYMAKANCSVGMRFKLLDPLTISTVIGKLQYLNPKWKPISRIKRLAEPIIINPIYQHLYLIILFLTTYNPDSGICQFHSGMAK